VIEFGGDASGVRKVFRFVAYGYDKYVHGAYITAMELFNDRTQTFMLRGEELDDKKYIYKQGVASALHQGLTALASMAVETHMSVLAREIIQGAFELNGSGEVLFD